MIETGFETLIPAERSRFAGLKRDYTATDVVRLRGTLQVRHTLAEHGAARLWSLLQGKDHINALGAVT